MPTEIDALSISIEAKAQKANSSIDKLVSRLDILSNSLGKIQNGSNNLVALGRGVESLSRGMQGFKGVGEAKFIRLANGINQLANINTQGLNNAASSLSHMTRAFNNIASVSQNAAQVAELAKGLGKLGNKSVTNAITNIPKLATAMNNLMTTLSKAPNVSQNVIQMTNALANLSAQGSKVGSASNSISKGLNRASNSATRARSSFGGLASAIGKFYATYFLFFRAFNGLWKSINMTADYVEAFNYYTVSLGKVASRWDADWENYADDNARNYANRFVTTLNSTFSKLSGVSYDPKTGLLSETGLTNLGLNLQQVTQYAAQLSSMMDAVGQSGETTLATTNAFVKLAGDISSLYNIDYQQAADKIRSVLQGQSRAGYGFGWDTTMAALQATADRLDLSKPVSEMAQWEKQQLRILTILEQSRVAWGDQSNTINTLANQIRIFKNNIAEAGMLLGQLFVPLMTKLMPIINGVTIAIKRLLSSIATLLGIEIKDVGQGFSDMEDDIVGIEDSFDNATAAAKKFKTYTLGIDELNIQPEQADSSGSGGGGIGGGIDLTDEILEATSEYEKVWQEAFDKMENRAQEFADRIEEFFKPITEPFANLDWETITKNLSDFAKALEPWADNFGEGFIEFWGDISETTAGIIEELFGEDGAIIKVTDWLNGNNPEKAKDWGYAFGVLSFGLGAIVSVAGATSLITKLATSLSFLGQALAIVASAYASLKVGLWLGKTLFPEDASFYDNFKLLGDGGFFDTIFADFKSTLSGFVLSVQNLNIGMKIANAIMGDEWYSELENIFIDNFNKFFSTNGSLWDKFLAMEENSDGQYNKMLELTKTRFDEIFGSIEEKWNGFVEWWETSAIGKWFKENVEPWFTKERWSGILISIPFAFEQAFKNGANLAIGFLNKIIEGIENLVNNAISGLSKVEDLVNLIPGIEISFDVPEFSLPRIPTFQTGGFPEDGLFMANRGELVGKFSNGRTAVANNEMIVEGIEYGVERAVERVLAPYLSDIARNTRETADKDMSVNIGDRDIARANARGSKSLGYALIY